jgi:hypothetical protein
MPSFEESRAIEHELEKTRADYYVTWNRAEFASYAEEAHSDALRVLARASDDRADLPRVAHLGDAWDNYIEALCDYEFYLVSETGAQGWEGTAFLDAYTADELLEFDAVAAYGMRWMDRADAEDYLEGYLARGGALIMDVSNNLGTISYSLQDTAFFDTVIRREVLPRDSELRVASEFAAAHPDIGEVESSPWVGEDGGAWSGASYEPLRDASDRTVIVSVGDKPAVVAQNVGPGRIYWIGYNLAWHAFINENDDEARVIEAVFEDAIAHTRDGASE